MAVESIFEKHRADPELTIRLRNGVYLQVAKMGGGTLFKRYNGEWLLEISIPRNGGIIGNNVLNSPEEINHIEALQQFAMYVSDNYEDTDESLIVTALEDFIKNDNYEVF